MQLEDFFDYKNQLMEDLLTTPDIVKLISDDEDIIEKPELLAYTQVFPYEYIPDTVEHGHTFVCFDIEVQKSLNKLLLSPSLYIWVFSHKNKLRLDEGGVRTDKLCSEIAKAINGSRKYGLGELDLYAVRRFAPLSDFQGKVLTFNALEINRVNPTGKPIPSNRKSG